MEQYFLDPELGFPVQPEALLETAFAIQGEVFRNIKNRKTMRFAGKNKNYFVKLHGGVGWKEIIKCLSQGKRPVLGAENEYRAIRLLEQLRIPTMTCRAFAKESGWNPAVQRSFIITDELTDKIPLEDFCRDWKQNPPDSYLKHRIIRTLAETCAKMHFAGLNHRDCYICHFLLDTGLLKQDVISLTVLDLHRAEIRKTIPRRMRVKDLAGIFFSSMDLGLKKQDALRFIAAYSRFGKLDAKLWDDVLKTAIRLYRKEWGKDPEV